MNLNGVITRDNSTVLLDCTALCVHSAGCPRVSSSLPHTPPPPQQLVREVCSKQSRRITCGPAETRRHGDCVRARARRSIVESALESLENERKRYDTLIRDSRNSLAPHEHSSSYATVLYSRQLTLNIGKMCRKCSKNMFEMCNLICLM